MQSNEIESSTIDSMQLFRQGLKSFDIQLSDRQIQQFLDYYVMLIEWNNVMNLTAITELNEVITKHFLDSLSLIKAIRLDKEKIIDIGTGAGFPGIPLKIAFPDIEIVLLDSLNKRIQFLNEVIYKLDLKKISTIHGRAEDFAKNKEYRENFDLCVSRAVAKLSTLGEYAIPYLKVGGYFISYKSGQVNEEISMAENALRLLGSSLDSVKEFTIPGTAIKRTLVIIKKNINTSKKYPRSAGKPSKEPL